MTDEELEATDPHHAVEITVMILDTKTGEVRQSPPYPAMWKGGWSTWWWTEGNGSCDCNRRRVFGHEDEDEEDGRCRGCERYQIVAVEPMLPGYSLADFNEGYPKIK